MELKIPHRAAPVIIEDCLSSTNTRLKKMAMEGAAEGTVLIARRQSGGRGRMDRQFLSPEGGLYLSMLLTPSCTPDETLSLTPCAAVAVQRAVYRLCGVSPDIKWPNDLLAEGRKICGILCESLFFQGQQKLIVGIGLNVSTPPEAFRGELAHIAGSLLSVTGSTATVDAAAAAVIAELDRMYSDWQADHGCCLEEYRRGCISCNRPVLLIRNDETRGAFSTGIDENYALCVRYADGSTEAIKTGEVSLRNV